MIEICLEILKQLKTEFRIWKTSSKVSNWQKYEQFISAPTPRRHMQRSTLVYRSFRTKNHNTACLMTEMKPLLKKAVESAS